MRLTDPADLSVVTITSPQDLAIINKLVDVSTTVDPIRFVDG